MSSSHHFAARSLEACQAPRPRSSACDVGIVESKNRDTTSATVAPDLRMPFKAELTAGEEVETGPPLAANFLSSANAGVDLLLLFLRGRKVRK